MIRAGRIRQRQFWWSLWLVGAACLALVGGCPTPEADVDGGADGDTVREVPNDGTVAKCKLEVKEVGKGNIRISPNRTWHEIGTEVALKAVPRAGYWFAYWEGDLRGNDNPTTLIMDADKQVTGVFMPFINASREYQLTVYRQGEGSVHLMPGDITLDDQLTTVTFDGHTQVTLEAVPAEGWRFDHWQGDHTGGDNPSNIVMDVSKTITAVFVPLQKFTLSVHTEGEGDVTLSPPETTCREGSQTYWEDTEVTLAVGRDPEWIFDHWEGDLQGDDDPATIVMDADHDVTAVLLRPDVLFDSQDDFDQGSYVGTEYDSVEGLLRLASQATTFPFIWVPNSNEGTISKVATRDDGEIRAGDEQGRYRVCPEDEHGDPSRTTVDIWGSCYVANRDTGTVVKVGLFEGGGYVDRNGNGWIETSRDLNGDGDITGAELLPWGEDECVLYEVVLTGEYEGTYAPGAFPPAPDVDYPSGVGTRSIGVDASNNVWVGAFNVQRFWYIDGVTGEILDTVDVSSVNHTPYGAVTDSYGIVWSSGQSRRHVLRLNPADRSYDLIQLGHFVYGLGIDRSNHLFVSGWDNSSLSCIDVTSGQVLWTKSSPNHSSSRGVAVTSDGDVWIAESSADKVTRWSNGGVFKAEIPVGITPTGVAVDADGKVWVVDWGDEYMWRIDPATNTVDLQKQVIGGRHYGYSDMTGIISGTVTTRRGEWTVVWDTQRENASYEKLRWRSAQPPNTSIVVSVRSSANGVDDWSDWEIAGNGTILTTTPANRYLNISVKMQSPSGTASPTLEYLGAFLEQ